MEVAVKVLLRGLRHDADDRALVELLWDYTPSTILAAEHLVGRLKTGGFFVTRIHEPAENDFGWFVYCASEFGVRDICFLMRPIDE